MEKEKDFEYEQKDELEVETKVNNYFKKVEKKYFRFQLRSKLIVLFTIIFIVAYITTAVLLNNFGTPIWTILLGIPVSTLIIHSMFSKYKIFPLLYTLIIITFILLGVFTQNWLYSALVLLLIPVIFAVKSVVFEYNRLKKAGKR